MRAVNKAVMTIFLICYATFLEAHQNVTIPNTWWDLGEEIRLLKLNCKAAYPIASHRIHLKSQNTIIIWKGQRWAGDEQRYIGFRYEGLYDEDLEEGGSRSEQRKVGEL